MAIRPELVCWDSCVIIDYLQEHETRYPEIVPIIDQAEKGHLNIVVSEICVAEVIKLDKSALSIADQASLIEDWFERPYVIPRVVDRGISTLAARLQRNHSIKTCDAIILATALRHDVGVVYTYDGWQDDGASKTRKMLSLDGSIPTAAAGEYLRIKAPSEYGQMPLRL